MRLTSGLAAGLAACVLLVAMFGLETRTPRVAAAVLRAAPAAGVQSSPGNSRSTQTQKLAAPEFFVMIDPSHGGDDHGCSFTARIQEKDVTLALARELRRQLEDRGIHARLLREGDINLSLERRAETTNQERAGIYVALHAGRPGNGVRIYSTAFPSPPAGAQGLVPWGAAQAAALERSRTVARAVSEELRKSDVRVSLMTAPLRPLNNVTAPAISMEWAPQPDDLKATQSAKMASKLTGAVAAGIAEIRGSMGARP